MQQAVRKLSAEQQQLNMGVQKLPNFSKELQEATDLISGIPGFDQMKHMAEKAAGALEGAAAGALTTLGETLNQTLATLTEQAERFHAEVSASRGNITRGVASVLGRLLHVSVEEVPVGRQFEVVANSTLIATVAIWKATDTSAEVAILGLTRGLDAAGFEEAAESFNSSLRGALANSASFVRTLEKVQVLLATGTDGADSSELLLQLPFVQRVLGKMNETMRAARKELSAFPQAFTHAFKGLEGTVVNASKATLSPAALAQVQTTFAGTRQQAEAMAESLAGSAAELLGCVDDGIAAASPQPLRTTHSRAVGLPRLAMLTLVLPAVVVLVVA